MIRKIRKFVNITVVEFQLSLSSEFIYRWQVLMWVVSDTIQPILLAILWSAVATSTDGGVTQTQMVSYYFMATIVLRFTQDWSMELVTESIVRGEFSKYLVRPYSYLGEIFGMSLAIRTIRIILLTPLLIIGYFFLRDILEYDITHVNVTLLFLAILIGFAVDFFLGNLFALSAFYIKQLGGLKAIYVNFASILSGEYIPYVLLPASMVILLQYLPFRYTLSFPVEIIMGTLTNAEIGKGFGIGLLWLLITIILYKVCYGYAVKKYESEGL